MASQLANDDTSPKYCPDTSLLERVDTSREVLADTSPVDRADARPCGWCKAPLADPRARYCHQRCRQTAWRARRELSLAAAGDRPMRLAYADPPYPGLARRYYGREPTYAGEVDHAALIASLEASYDGWALSTSARALRDLLPLCPPEARVCSWTKPGGVPPGTRGLHSPRNVVPSPGLTPRRGQSVASATTILTLAARGEPLPRAAVVELARGAVAEGLCGALALAVLDRVAEDAPTLGRAAVDLAAAILDATRAPATAPSARRAV